MREAGSTFTQQREVAEIGFVCPACKGELLEPTTSYQCAQCERTYPILFGIPDFRLRPDRYLPVTEERAKAQRLHEFAQGASFEALVRYYYEITDDVPPNLARHFRNYIRSAPSRAQFILDDFQPHKATHTLLDVGCGSGGLLLAAAGRYRAVFGVDIALRWLVICQKRLADEGIAAILVCADVEALPFRQACFTHVAAADLIEHVYDVDGAISAIWRSLEPGGTLWVSAANRYSIGPQASTRVWGVGFLPPRARSWFLRTTTGVDLLRHVNLVSPAFLTRILEKRGFALVARRPKSVPAETSSRTFERALVALYHRMSDYPLLSAMLLRFGPAFEIVSRKASPPMPSDGVHPPNFWSGRCVSD
jgi:2-polyprenyl-3-methyl-5-hydroxy-6-metoxy-1,4-benzoquinol methylase/uncharacterized protein YbaR (Trm112 family)